MIPCQAPHEAPHQHCHSCGQCHGFAVSAARRDEWPEPGSVSICVTCGVLGTYVHTPMGLIIRPATPEEAAEYGQLPTVREALAQVAEWRRGRRTG